MVTVSSVIVIKDKKKLLQTEKVQQKPIGYSKNLLVVWKLLIKVICFLNENSSLC